MRLVQQLRLSELHPMLSLTFIAIGFCLSVITCNKNRKIKMYVSENILYKRLQICLIFVKKHYIVIIKQMNGQIKEQKNMRLQ